MITFESVWSGVSKLLRPGADRTLAGLDRAAHNPGAPDARRIALLFAKLTGPQAADFLRPGASVHKLGELLPSTLLRLSGKFTPEGADGIAGRFHSQLTGTRDQDGRVDVERTVTRLNELLNAHRHDADIRAASTEPAELPSNARTVRDLLTGPFADHVKSWEVTDELALKWGREIGVGPRHVVAKAIADRLQMAHHARDLTRDGQPVRAESIDWTGQAFQRDHAPLSEAERERAVRYGI